VSEIRIDVKAKNDSAKAFADLKMTASDVRGEMERLDGQARNVERDMLRLDDAAKKHRNTLRELAAAFANAGDEVEKKDIAGKIGEIERELTLLSKAKKIKISEMIDIDSDRGALQGAGEKSVGLIGRGIAAGKGSILSAGTFIGESLGTQIGLTAGPVIVSAMGGALSAGAGMGGIGAGIALAIASDSGFKDAGAKIGKDLFGGITQRAHTAFYEPIKGILDDLGNYGDQIVDQWGDAFEDLAPALDPFVTSISNTVTKLSGVIADIAGDSGPALEAFADGFATIGDSVGNALERITDDTEQNADSLKMLLEVAAGAIDVFGLLADAAIEAAGPLVQLYDASYKLGESIGEVAIYLGMADEPLHEFARWTGDSSDAMQEAADAANSETDALQGLADQLKAQTDPAFALISAQNELTDASKAYEKAVKKSGKGSRDAQDALIDLAKASMDLESAAEKAGGTFDGTVSPALRNTMKAAGLTDAQIDGVAGAFRGARKAGDNFARSYKANVSQTGAQGAAAAIRNAASAARAYEGQYVASLQVKMNRLDAGKFAHGGIVGQAAHGATSSGLTWIGEQGPELVSLPAGSRVWSGPDSRRLNARMPSPFSDGAHPATPGPMYINLKVDGRTLATAIVDPMREMISSKAGGVVQRMFGQGS
jgi:hypothetical protein